MRRRGFLGALAAVFVGGKTALAAASETAQTKTLEFKGGGLTGCSADVSAAVHSYNAYWDGYRMHVPKGTKINFWRNPPDA